MKRIGLLVLMSVATQIGCGGKGDISGKITFKGKPVAGGTVTFVAKDKMPYQGPIGEDGSYSLSGVPTGEVKIGVTSPRPGGLSAREKALQGDRREDVTGPKIDPKKWVAIPGDYAFFEKSGLSYVVKSGKNQHDIELTAK